MCELLTAHFRTAGEQSRCMVFTSFRDSVRAAARPSCACLHGPGARRHPALRSQVLELKQILESIDGVRPMHFVGQARGSGVEGAAGMKQGQQREVVRNFRQGGFNVPGPRLDPARFRA